MDLLRRPDVNYEGLMQLPCFTPGVQDAAVAQQVQIQAKYAGYIDRQQREAEKVKRYEHWQIPTDFCYDQLAGLSNEMKEKLNNVRPNTVAQAGRIPGVTPAAVSLLVVQLTQPR